MPYVSDKLNDKHRELTKIIRKETEIVRAKSLFLEIHALLNFSDVSNTQRNETDNLLGDLAESEYSIMVTKRSQTIAWVLWHITRIEDLTMNIIVAGHDPIFNDDWQERLNINIIDTGIALSKDELLELSKRINIKELIRYRNEVAKRTREIIGNLKTGDMKRRVAKSDVDKIFSIGGVAPGENSVWLLDFWGSKDIAGILLMPPTRHVMMHFEDCFKWKEKFRAAKHEKNQ